MHIPPIIQQLAATAGGTPIAWKEYDHHYVIVFEDGRKLAFRKSIGPTASASKKPSRAKRTTLNTCHAGKADCHAGKAPARNDKLKAES